MGRRGGFRPYRLSLDGFDVSAALTSHWQVTHLVMPELKRMEKTVAAMAAGAWLLRAEYLDCSLVEGRLLAPEVQPSCGRISCLLDEGLAMAVSCMPVDVSLPPV